MNDPRVDVWESNKFVARMQAASAKPVIYRLDYASGHGIGSTADANKDWAADIAAFVLEVTRVDTGNGTAGAAP
ncbi:prolyl oligopeptidase family serine peptidase [Luteimonas aestuarii]|uniref:prolyl oligopeptidase family serine peptidase n=1 Tax=Luteimonas aestuarii TaxID=453837 RepID=UPI001404AD2E|nr:prolyl oligopeptidase family serine peptidase [Luteimonas aestuarii]